MKQENKKYQGYPLEKICPFCGDEVVFTSNKELYGREYGNGKCYLCRNCKASTGTHPDGSALGRLANREMKELKKECHALFDPIWRMEKVVKRPELYSRLAKKMNIPKKNCHFGHFGVEELNQALVVLRQSGWYEKENE